MEGVSAVIPAFDSAATLDAAIRSVLDQEHPVCEVVVVDDGSRDGSAALAESFGEPVRCIRQENAGAAAARNRGIRVARGDWIAFLDSDDVWLPGRLARQLELVSRHPELQWVAGRLSWLAADGRRFAYRQPEADALLHDGVLTDTLAALALSWCISTDTILVRREALERVAGFDARLRTGEDRDLWIRLALEWPRMGWVDEPVALAGQRASSLSRSSRPTDDPSPLLFSRKMLELARRHEAPRAGQLAEIARANLRSHTCCALRAGQSGRARTLLAGARELALGPSLFPWWMELAARVPEPLLRGMRAVALALRGKRGWD